MRRGVLRPASCRRAARQLPRYLDGESDPDAAWRVARHLSQCEDCFADADAFRQVKDAVAQLRRPLDADGLARLRRLLQLLAGPAADA